MARSNGQQWDVLPMPTEEALTDVFVAAPDEHYATGTSGSLLEGRASGWGVITRTVDDRLPYACVAKWQGQLYVGGGPLSLFRRIGTTSPLDHIEPNVRTVAFDARSETLLITAENMIVGTADGKVFQAAGIDQLAKLTDTQDILT